MKRIGFPLNDIFFKESKNISSNSFVQFHFEFPNAFSSINSS